MQGKGKQSRGDRICFGNFEVDPFSSELYCKGRRIKLQEQPFRILAMLLERPGEMVSRDALRRALWPEDTFVDFDVSLNTAIRKLRTALDDAVDHPRYVETLPRRGYRFIARVQTPRRHPRSIDSVAVLPFVGAGDEPDAEYLSDGITESLIHALSEFPTLKRVTALSSVNRYKGHEVDLREVGKALGVRAALTGKVLLRSGKVSVSAELLDTSDLGHVWGVNYQRKLAEIPELQDEIACEIASELKVKFSPRSKRAPARITRDLAAYQLYLQGRYWWNKRPSQGAVQKGIEFFDQAITKDPSFALPYVGLADSYNTLAAWESGIMAPKTAYPMVRAAAGQALKADPTLSEAHTSLAYAELHFGWNWRRAQKEFRRALSLNSNYAYCHHWYSHYLTAMGKTEDSLAESIRIIELDPLDLIINVHLAWHYYMSRQHGEALHQSNRTLEMEPAFHWGYFFRGLALEQLQDFGDAIDALRKSVDLSGGSTVMLSALGHAYAAAGDTVGALDVLKTLHEQSLQRYISSYEIALIHAGLGENDQAFEWFDRACEERSGWLPYLNAEPRVDRLRSHSRFQALVNAIGLPMKSDAPR